MRALTLALAVVLSSCTARGPDFAAQPVNLPSSPAAPSVTNDPRAGKLVPIAAPEEGVVPLPDPDKQNGHVGRAPRRVTVDQLSESIRVVTEHEWKELPGRAQSLGKADYSQVNTESTETNLVFAKFLEDGARDVCTLTAKDDALRPQAQRVLSRELTDPTLKKVVDAEVEANLLYLSRRFWGSRLSAQELPTWTAFFKKTAARSVVTSKPQEALAVTCIALMTDPRFFSY